MTNRFLIFAFFTLFCIGLFGGWNVPLTHLVFSVGLAVFIRLAWNLWDTLCAESV